MKKICSLLLAAVFVLSLCPFGIQAASLWEANKYDFFTSYCGYPSNSGANTYSECYQTSDFIPVKAGDTVTAGPFRDGQKVYVTVYNSNKKGVIRQISSISALTSVGSLDGAGTIRKFTVPVGGAFVRITLGAEYYNTFLVTVNQNFTAEEYTAAIEAEGLSRYLEFNRADKSRYAKQKLLAVGDSVGHGSYEKNYEGATKSAVSIAFAGRLKNLLGFSGYSNYAQGGATFTDKNPTRILKQIQDNAKKNTPYLLIEGGMVDLYAYQNTVEPWGYLSDSFDPATFAPENTFIGGLERSLYAATTQSPNAVIAFLIPYSVKVAYGGHFGWERLFQWIPIVCEKWGVPVIDLYNNETVNNVMSVVDSIGPNLILYDNLHCAPHTYTACSLELAMEFYNLPKYDKNNRKIPADIPAEISKSTWKTPDPGKPPVKITMAENLYTGQNLTAYENSSYKKAFVTSDFIAVKPGDVITLGPCSPYCLRQIQGFDAAQKDVTGYLDNMSTELVSVLTSGYLILKYTVPENVYFIKASFERGAVSPVITVNKPFDGSAYVAWLSAALAGTPAVYTEPVTSAPETAPATVVPAATSDDEVPEPGVKNGCFSFCGSAAAICLAALPLFLRRRERD